MSRVDVISTERLLDDRHHHHEIRDFWQNGPVALVFLRQFGSAFALKQAVDLNTSYDAITAAGANVVLIGLGTPIQAFTFRKRAETRFPILTTADQSLYRTMGLTRAWRASHGPTNIAPLDRSGSEWGLPVSKDGRQCTTRRCVRRRTRRCTSGLGIPRPPGERHRPRGRDCRGTTDSECTHCYALKVDGDVRSRSSFAGCAALGATEDPVLHVPPAPMHKEAHVQFGPLESVDRLAERGQ
ncbi:AhpC/TSA family protein [Antrihabitans spumae]|uniref:AhpC/TSA family protein n=1 Tax=Antrihabitans spumae TaxID=3373370 RepID=A0ABW7K1W2_9NOCA